MTDDIHASGVPELCLHQLFEVHARKTPQHPAVYCGHRCLTYGELDVVAEALSQQLRSLGIGPEKIVGIYMERSVELIVGILAIMKAGGAFLPLDPAYPAQRLAFMLEESEAPVLLTTANSAATVPTSSARIEVVNLSELARCTVQKMASKPAANNAAYIVYTSGSTGKPKGVVVEHRSVTNYIHYAAGQYGIRPTDRVLQVSSISFDASIEEIFVALCSGAMLVLRDDEMISSAAVFFDRCSQLRITVLGLPTSFWHELVVQADEQQLPIPPLLRALVIGGEQASLERLKQWRQRAGRRVALFNTYGPTETCIVATMFRVPDDWSGNHIPIGKPVAGAHVSVVDAQLRPVAHGEEGELCIGGIGVARGYLKRPDLTEQRFIRSLDGTERFYRTGDRVRMLPDGNLEFLGRMDEQVKIRGFRIEPAEIENALNKHPVVRQCLVVAQAESAGQKQLVAYIVAKSRTEPEIIRRFLADALPDYMVPSRYVFIPAFPIGPNGKIDRKALPEPTEADAGAPRDATKPQTPLELNLQLAFGRFFNQTNIGRETSFFELGGNSLQAIRLIVDIEQRTGKQLPLDILFRAPTIKNLARAIGDEVGAPGSSCLVPLQTNGDGPPLFLVHTTPGDVLGYGNLVFHLGTEHPCYGFQSRGLHQPELAHGSIEEMAAHYIEQMRSIQPHGPYLLGGWCYGGIVCVEMAQQLKAAGEKIALLALIETPAQPPGFKYPRFYVNRLKRLVRMSASEWRTYIGAKFDYYKDGKDMGALRFRESVEASENRATDLSDPSGYADKLALLYDLNLKAVNKYKTKPYDGRVVLFNASEQDPAMFPDPLYGWSTLAAKVEIHVTPGTHDSILMEPNVKILAQQLRRYLSKALGAIAALWISTERMVNSILQEVQSAIACENAILSSAMSFI